MLGKILGKYITHVFSILIVVDTNSNLNDIVIMMFSLSYVNLREMDFI